jgi:hypothetical protein
MLTTSKHGKPSRKRSKYPRQSRGFWEVELPRWCGRRPHRHQCETLSLNFRVSPTGCSPVRCRGAARLIALLRLLLPITGASRYTLHDGRRRSAEHARRRSAQRVLRCGLPDVGSIGGSQRRGSRAHELTARFRFLLIGHLLAAPPSKGSLGREFDKLAAREWRHPVSGEPIRVGVSPSSAGTTAPARSRTIRSACCGASWAATPASRRR